MVWQGSLDYNFLFQQCTAPVLIIGEIERLFKTVIMLEDAYIYQNIDIKSQTKKNTLKNQPKNNCHLKKIYMINSVINANLLQTQYTLCLNEGRFYNDSIFIIQKKKNCQAMYCHKYLIFFFNEVVILHDRNLRERAKIHKS